MALKNVGASVRARLLSMAQKRHDSFEGLLVRYVHERLLYRLGRSEQATRFALKGALLFPLWGPEVPRATRDLDLLWHGDSSPEALAEVFRALCLMDEPDGVTFDPHSVAAQRIREHQDYVGVRVVLRADVDEARVRVQVDLGFGDAVDPPPQRVTYPSLLDAPAPVVMAYPREVVIAEKFQAIGAEPLGEGAPAIVGLSEETTCFVSLEYFSESDPFADFVVHEMAHIFHNCKRDTVGLPVTRRREWLLDIDYGKRETFAYSCEAYARIVERTRDLAGRDALAREYGREVRISEVRVDPAEVADILREAAPRRNGWKVILARCAPLRRSPARTGRTEIVEA
jgi:hypothetical protein